MSVESRLPLGQREGPPSPPMGEVTMTMSELSGTDESAPSSGGLNTSGPLDFPIEAAFDAHLTTVGLLGVPAETSRCELGVDELALVWVAPTSALHGGAGAGDEVGGELVDAVLLPESAGEQVNRPIWERGRCASPRLVAQRDPIVPALGGGLGGTARFAFVFDSRRSAAEPRGEYEVALTPLDSLYLARLCAYDDGQSQLLPAAGEAGSKNGVDSTGCPPHLLSSDEVLAALLHQREVAALSAAEDPLSSKCATDGAS